MLKEFGDHTGHCNRAIVIGISYITIFVLLWSKRQTLRSSLVPLSKTKSEHPLNVQINRVRVFWSAAYLQERLR